MSSEPPAKKRKLDVDDDWWKSSRDEKDDVDQETQNKTELIEYFASIDYMIQNESFEDSQQEEIFVNNMIKQMERFEDTVFMFEHPDISQVIEKIVQLLSGSQVCHLISKFVVPNLYELVSRKCSSHVVQSMISLLPALLLKNVEQASELVCSMVTKLRTHGLAQLLMSETSTFVMRDVLFLCSGVVRLQQAHKRQRMKLHHVRKIPSLQKFNTNHVPSEAVPFAQQVAQSLLEHADKKQNEFALCKESSTMCASLQVLIECLFITKAESSLVQSLIDEICKPSTKEHVLHMIMDESSSHLMQAAIEFGNKNVALHLVQQHMQSSDIRDIAQHRCGNHVLQSILRRLFDAKTIEFIACALQDNIAALFDSNKIGVLHCLMDAFTRAKLKPSALVTSVVQVISNSDSHHLELIDRFLYLNLNDAQSERRVKANMLNRMSSKYSVPGCLLLQSIIRSDAEPSSSVCRHVVELVEESLVAMCYDSSASHVVQSLIESPFVVDSLKWQLLCKLEDRFRQLCTHKFGNYIIESSFYSLGFPFKVQFAKKIARHASVLKGSKLGSMLYFKMKLDLVEKDEERWKQHCMRQRKHKKHFNDATHKPTTHKKAERKSIKDKPNVPKQPKAAKQERKIQTTRKHRIKQKKANKLF